MGKKAIAAFDRVGWKPYADDENLQRARVTNYTEKGGEMDLPESEYKRLAALGALQGYEENAPFAVESDVVLSPALKPNDEPSDDRTVGTPLDQHEPRIADPLADVDSALKGLTVAELKDLAAENDVEVVSGDTKADLMQKLSAAGVVSPSSSND